MWGVSLVVMQNDTGVCQYVWSTATDVQNGLHGDMVVVQSEHDEYDDSREPFWVRM